MTFIVFGNHPNGMDNTWYESEYRKENIKPECPAYPNGKKDTERRENNGK